MEHVPDIPAAVPVLVAYPSESLRRHVPPEEWNAFVDTWLVSLEYRLRLKAEHFSRFKFSQNASGVPFLLSYLTAYEGRVEPIRSGSAEARLHHRCYFLLKRLLLTTATPYDCSPATIFELLGTGCTAFHAVADWRATLKQVWKKNPGQVKNAVESYKSVITKGASSTQTDRLTHISRLNRLVRCLPEVAVTAMAGVDYLEAITNTYVSNSLEVQKMLTETTYHCLRSLMSDGQKHTTLLLDILVELKSENDRIHGKSIVQSSLLSSLVCTTPFIRHLTSDDEIANGKRGQGLIKTLSTFRQMNARFHPVPEHSKRTQKGKQSTNQNEDLHMHQASKVSQVHDLFPDFSNAYILRLLDHYADNVEAVIAALLEPESLPVDLQHPQDIVDAGPSPVNAPPDLMPRSTPPLPPQRRNVFDDDEFDKLQISSSRLQKGRRNVQEISQTEEQRNRNKAAIIAALAAFDSDDDERDDTYDVADVGATVDNTLDSDETRNQATSKHEETLFRAWSDTPEMFARDSKTRVSNLRSQLKQETRMTDEQIEGWAIMMTRDTKMADRLRARYSNDRTFHGQQQAVERTRWDATASASESQDEGNTSSDGRRIGQAGIRGARQWNRGRGRGGSTSGPADTKETQLARKRKEQGRGRGGASHNRREGRAKKMG